MMKIICIVILFLPLKIFSQGLCPCNFKGFAATGIVVGQSEVKALAQFSGGITYDNDQFYTGIGIGIDPYRFNSIPLFADWRMRFGKKRNAFIYGNIGYAIPYDNESDDEPMVVKVTDRFNGGMYTDAGIGYRFREKGKGRFIFSAGHSYKRISNVTTSRYSWCPTCAVENYTYRYDLNRIVAKLSWEFGK